MEEVLLNEQRLIAEGLLALIEREVEVQKLTSSSAVKGESEKQILVIRALLDKITK